MSQPPSSILEAKQKRIVEKALHAKILAPSSHASARKEEKNADALWVENPTKVHRMGNSA